MFKCLRLHLKIIKLNEKLKIIQKINKYSLNYCQTLNDIIRIIKAAMFFNELGKIINEAKW